MNGKKGKGNGEEEEKLVVIDVVNDKQFWMVEDEDAEMKSRKERFGRHVRFRFVVTKLFLQ